MSFFLTGLWTGVVLTFLLAPRSGAATRSLIGRTVKDSENWIKDKGAAAENYVSTRSAAVGDGIKKAVEALERS